MITELDVDPLPRQGSGGADLSATEREGLDPYRAGFPPAMQRRLADRYRELFTLGPFLASDYGTDTRKPGASVATHFFR